MSDILTFEEVKGSIWKDYFLVRDGNNNMSNSLIEAAAGSILI